MVVDSSALVAIFLREPERLIFEDLILRAPFVVMSAVALLETHIVLTSKRRDFDGAHLDDALLPLRAEVRPFDFRQAALAREAFTRYGRGRHAAGLNFGDCCTYALAKARDDVLLFKGEDFSKTDIVPAWRP